MPNPAFQLNPRSRQAFTLTELLVVIGIIGLLAVVGLPALRSFTRTGGMSSAQRQLLDDVARARHLAMVNRTTVLMVFVPPDIDEFLRDNQSSLTQSELQSVTNLLVGRYTSYNFISLKSVGDQPGRSYPKYLEGWKHLPEGVFILPQKFGTTAFTTTDARQIPIAPFNYTKTIPFPQSRSKPYTTGRGLPYIAFNPSGQMIAYDDKMQVISAGNSSVIPLALGSIIYDRDVNGNATADAPEVRENAPRSALEAYNLIEINPRTGRGRYVTPDTLR